MAATAVGISPCPEIIRTGVCASLARIAASASRPSMPGILMSSRTASGVSRRVVSIPAGPEAASTHSYPSYSRTIRSDLRIASSSSMTRTLCFIGPDSWGASISGNRSAGRDRLPGTRACFAASAGPLAPAERGRAGVPAEDDSSNHKKAGPVAGPRWPRAAARTAGHPAGADRLFLLFLHAQAQRDVPRDRVAAGAGGRADDVQHHQTVLLHLAELAAVLGDGLDGNTIDLGDDIALAETLLERLGHARHPGHQDALGLVRQVE